MKRRALLRGLASGIAGTVAGAAAAPIAASTDVPHYAQSPSTPTPAAAEGPRLLDEHQRRTLASIADMMVPGSTEAGVVDLIDRVSAVDSPARQRRFLNALGAFEHQARRAHGVRWIDLDEPARLKILQEASTGVEGRPRPPAWVKGQPLVFAPTDPAPPATPRDHFDYLRSVVATAYFATEAGMRELGWTGRAVFTSLPGCTHADEHA
jgi:Gluconate 2-dehydrogenase subunit 3